MSRADLALRVPLLATLVLTSSACAEDPPPPIVWEGAHVQVGTDLDLAEWCPGTLTRLDDFTGAIKQLFEVPDTHLVQYYVYPPPLSAHEVCPGDALGCAIDTAVHTTELFHPHEVVHAVSEAHGGMPYFFEEGAATYWGKDPPPTRFWGLDMREVLDTHWSKRSMGRRGYALAANFTAYLFRAHGLEAYQSLVRDTSWGQSRAQFEVVFADIYGVSLDEAIEDYEENWPYCEIADREAPFYECSRPATVLTGKTEFDLDISCADPEVVGPSDRLGEGEARIWRDLTVEIVSDLTGVAFSAPALAEPNTVIVQVTACDSDCSGNATFTLVPDGTGIETHSNWFVFDTLPGRHVIRVSRAADDPGPVRFRVLQ